MEDLRTLSSLLTSPRPPLSEAEKKDLEKIISTISQSQRKEELTKKVEPLEMKSLFFQKPPDVIFENPSLQIQVPSDCETILTVAKDKSEGNYLTISEAIDASREGTTILVSSGTFSETLSIRKHVILASVGGDISSCRFSLIGCTLTLSDFKINPEGEFISMSKSTLFLSNCSFFSEKSQYTIIAENCSTINILKSQLSCSNILQSSNNSVVNVLDSTLNGRIETVKSEVTLDLCKITNKNGPCIEVFGSTLNVANSQFYECNDYGISCSGKSLATINNSTFENINGYGIWCQTNSKVTVKNVSLKSCQKPAFQISDSSTVTANSISIEKCTNNGIYAGGVSNCKFHELYMNENGNFSIFIEGRTAFHLERANLQSEAGVGIHLNSQANLKTYSSSITGFGSYCVSASNSEALFQSCEINKSKSEGIFLKSSKIELINCNILDNKLDGLSANERSKVQMNNCFFINNSGLGLTATDAQIVKIIGSAFDSNSSGGILINRAELAQIDRSRIVKNSFKVKQIKQGVVRLCLFNECRSRKDKYLVHVETEEKSNFTFEDNFFIDSLLFVRRSTCNVRRNEFTRARAQAIFLDNKSNVTIDSNHIHECSLALISQDHVVSQITNNIVENIFSTKGDQASKKIVFSDQKRKAFNIKKFSESSIENNVVSGTYDYAIFVDSQSKAFIKNNRLESGQKGIVIFIGVSSGYCPVSENTFTGNYKDHPVDFQEGCDEIRK